MKFLRPLVFVLSCLLLGVPFARAQTSLETMQAAATFRADLVASVANGTETVAEALKQLSQRSTASGLSTLAPSEDQAQAALGIAYQLMGMDRPDLAEPFFRAAEHSLMQASRLGHLQPKRRAQHLRTLALVRASYLNELGQARSDLDEAARLQPDDPSIAKFARQLKERSEGPRRGKPGN